MTPLPVPRLAPALLLVLFAPGLPAQDGGDHRALAILERASRRYEALEGLCADFAQVRRVPLLDQVTRSEGRLCHKEPNLFLMDFSDPENDVVVADGRHLWIYYPSVDPGQVFRQDLGRGGRFDFHREFLSEPGEKYDPTWLGEAEVDGHPAVLLRLVPRGPSPYVEARVWIDREGWLIRKVSIREENESVREVVLSDIEPNPSLPDEAFRFTPPPGAQVIER